MPTEIITFPDILYDGNRKWDIFAIIKSLLLWYHNYIFRGNDAKLSINTGEACTFQGTVNIFQ